MIVIICGDRNWTDENTIDDFIKTLPPKSTIIHGNCRGADKIAGRLGKMRRHDVVAVPAEWDEYGKAAGPIRNRRMLDNYNVEMVMAFHDDLSASKGTKNMIAQALAKGVRYRVQSSVTKVIDE